MYKFLRMLCIIFNFKLYFYNKKCNDFIKRIIADGKIIDIYYYEVKVKYKDDYYLLWTANKYYSCLTRIIKLPKEDNRLITTKDIIFDDVRPSRKTEIRFFNWLEENDIK